MNPGQGGDSEVRVLSNLGLKGQSSERTRAHERVEATEKNSDLLLFPTIMRTFSERLLHVDLSAIGTCVLIVFMR